MNNTIVFRPHGEVGDNRPTTGTDDRLEDPHLDHILSSLADEGAKSVWYASHVPSLPFIVGEHLSCFHRNHSNPVWNQIIAAASASASANASSVMGIRPKMSLEQEQQQPPPHHVVCQRMEYALFTLIHNLHKNMELHVSHQYLQQVVPSADNDWHRSVIAQSWLWSDT